MPDERKIRRIQEPTTGGWFEIFEPDWQGIREQLAAGPQLTPEEQLAAGIAYARRRYATGYLRWPDARGLPLRPLSRRERVERWLSRERRALAAGIEAYRDERKLRVTPAMAPPCPSVP